MTIQRDAKGHWLPGQGSANPGGRKASGSIRKMIDAVVCDEDWQKLIQVLYKKAMKGDLKAIEILLDRRFGKPTQPITGDDEGGTIRVMWKNLSDDQHAD